MLKSILSKGLLILVIFSASIACTEKPISYIEIDYQTDEQEFTNPERGFYRAIKTKVSDFKPLDASILVAMRSPKPAAGGFKVASTLTYRAYHFDTFKDKPLNDEVLQGIQKDMNTIREVGNKMILRFQYTEDCCDPPFNDAPKSTILEHLEQLKPLFIKNEDVIAVVQMGLIGPWGEQFYSDHFGDLEHGPVTDQNWLDRSEVIEKLLEVVPKSRMVQVRAPYYKLRYLDGPSAHPEKATSVTADEAFSEKPIARIAHHNDCILANADDYWTYNSFHEWPAVSDTLNLKKYIADETKYLVFGGETCPGGPQGEDIYSPFNDCISDGGGAETYLKRFHTSFLNTAWSGAVNGDWNNKCIDDIKRSLGYRFVLEKAKFPKEIRNGEKLNIELNIVNKGYASTYNYRYAELILRNAITQKVYKNRLDVDTRYWFSDEVQHIIVDNEWPENIPKGNYELFLNLPDAAESINNRAEYAIRLASLFESKSIFDTTTGWNLILPSISVTK